MTLAPSDYVVSTLNMSSTMCRAKHLGPTLLPVADTLGGRLKVARRQAKLTQTQLGKQVGYDQSDLSRLEKDQKPDLAAHAELFVAIADALGTSLDYLLAARVAKPRTQVRDHYPNRPPALEFARACGLPQVAIDEAAQVDLGERPDMSVRGWFAVIEDFARQEG